MQIEAADTLLGGPTSDKDVDIEEADAQPPSFVPPNQDVMNIDSDDGTDSDSTLLGDETLERNIPSFYSAHPRPPQVRTPAASFRELHTHTQNGRTFQVGRIFPDQDGDLRRVTSIKRHRVSGRIAIESIQDNSLRTLETHSYDGRTLKFGKTVEVADAFLRINAILEDRRTGDIFLRGFRFQRTLSLDGVLPLKRNEVAMILKHDKMDCRDILEQSLEVVELAAVVRIRELIKTNQQFPALSYRETDLESQKSSKQFIYDHCRLVCRWNYLKISKNEGSLRKMTDEESDEGHSIAQYHLKHDFRGLTTPGGDCPGWLDTEESFDRKERRRCFFIDPLEFHPRLTNPPRPRAQQRRYTFGDGFCGCGGASRGAYGAGLRIAWGFDQDPHAIATYHENFPSARCEGIAVNDFITALDENYKVDVLHLSPPCKTFSPAHTRPGPNDESNGASFLAIEELLKKVKPRVVTLEETFGLTRNHEHLPWFNAMIQSLTKLGFSVRWKVFNLQDFGLPQPRRRLFLFASCPGEVLPDFPEPTHCKPEDRPRFPHLRKSNTVNDAIGRIPRNFPNHSPHRMTQFVGRPRPRYSGDRPLSNTITCGGNNNHHTSGTRYFTVRELACLQGFPLEHRFLPRRGERRQIGNAVPPVVARVFFEKVVEALRAADGL